MFSISIGHVIGINGLPRDFMWYSVGNSKKGLYKSYRQREPEYLLPYLGMPLFGRYN